MESPSANFESSTSCQLEDTIELPSRKTARSRVDIYLPQALDDWSGPALQEFTSQHEDFSGLNEPLRGMLRPTDAAFGQYPASKAAAQSPKVIRSYARRSAKRGLFYTLLFIAVLASGVMWVTYNFDTLHAELLKNFN